MENVNGLINCVEKRGQGWIDRFFHIFLCLKQNNPFPRPKKKISILIVG
jgi:hypothetical protein